MPRVFQYQALAEPLPQPAPAPVTFTQPEVPDLAARAAVLPAAILAGALFFVAPVAAAPVLTPTPAVVAPDFLRLSAARTHLQPASAFVGAAPFPEITSADRWKPIIRDWLYAPRGRPSLEPASVLGRAGPFPEATSADRWKPILRDWLRAPLGQPHLAAAGVTPFPIAAPLTLGAASFGPDRLRVATGRVHLEPPSLLGRAAPYAEAVTADRWKPILRDFLRAPLGQPSLLPTSVSAFPVTAPITLGWGSAGPDWLRPVTNRSHLEPATLLGRAAPFPETTSADRWKPILRDFLHVPRGRPHLDQVPFVPRVVAAPVVTLGAAFVGPDFLRATVGRAHLEAPGVFGRAAPFPEAATVDRWKPTFPDWLRVPAGRPQIEPSPLGIRLAPAAAVMGTAIFPDWLRATYGRPYLEPQSVFGRTVFRETVSADRWKPILRDFLYVPRRQPSLEPAAVLGRAAPFPERVTVDRWKGSAPDILRAVQSRAHLLPATAGLFLVGGVVVPWHLFYRVR